MSTWSVLLLGIWAVWSIYMWEESTNLRTYKKTHAPVDDGVRCLVFHYRQHDKWFSLSLDGQRIISELEDILETSTGNPVRRGKAFKTWVDRQKHSITVLL